MARIEHLPVPLERVTIPEFFGPSQLAYGHGCPLKVVLKTERGIPALRKHPVAEIGSVFHELLERAVRGHIPLSSRPRDDVRRMLDSLLAGAEARLSSDLATASYANLEGIVTPLAWRRKVGTIVDAACKLSSIATSQKTYTALGSSPTLTFERLGKRGRWAEIKISEPSLRLQGRIDVVEKEELRITIRDLKTGRVVDRSGQVLRHVELQLRLYGIMVRQRTPEASIELVVDDGVERKIPFDKEIERATATWLLDFMRGLPPNATLEARDIARPGEECSTCSHRHICPSYREMAPKTWIAPYAHRLPLDIHGRVEQMHIRPDGFADIVLQDAAHRKVKLFGIEACQMANVQPGDQLWFFNLRALTSYNGQNEWRHPANFHEVSLDDPLDRAWTLQVFR